jgi:hypothetical protein
MSRTFSFTAEKIIPEKADVFAIMGITGDKPVGEKLLKIYDDSTNIFLQICQSAAITEDITKEDFVLILEGAGKNEPFNPISDIYPKAESLTLFALTLGKEISVKIEMLFAENNFALGYVLDAIASEAAERAADSLQTLISQKIHNRAKSDIVSLRYSPGYCGWHISGQKILFERLKPEEIGITLNNSFLMQPLKSISGVIVSAEREYHLIKNNYPFCAACPHRSCRERINLLLNK